MKHSAFFSHMVALAVQLEEGNHEHTSQQYIGTQPGNGEFRSIWSAKYALTWTQTHPCTSRMARSCQHGCGALSCHAPSLLYPPSDSLHRCFVWCRTTHS